MPGGGDRVPEGGDRVPEDVTACRRVVTARGRAGFPAEAIQPARPPANWPLSHRELCRDRESCPTECSPRVAGGGSGAGVGSLGA